MNVLAVVPARSGSKGFPNKNIASLNNVSLLEMAVLTGSGCKSVTDVYISTDSPEYEKIALGSGARSVGLRPANLASDTAKTSDVVLDMLGKLEKHYDYIVLLQPTSPLRTSDDIDNMLQLTISKNADACVSLNKIEEPHPHKMKSLTESGYVRPFLEGTTSEMPRQSLPPVYALNGAIYVVRTDVFIRQKSFLPENTLPYIMNRSINIDREEDFILLKSLFESGKISLYDCGVK